MRTALNPVWVGPVPGMKEALVCGLDWHTVLGKDAVHRARKLARQYKASLIAQDPDRTEGVGLLPARHVSTLLNSVTHYSAALVVASMYPKGVVIACFSLSPEQWWVVGVQEGKVLQATDRVVDAAAERDTLLRSLIERFDTQVLICGDGHEASQEVFAFEAVAAHRKASHQLRRVLQPRWPFSTRSLMVMGAAAALTVAGRMAWDGLQSEPAPFDDVALELVAPDEPSPELHFAAQTWTLPSTAWPALLEEVAALPLWLGGWRFQQARCAPQGAYWRCQVQYERVHAWANNLTFLESRPDHWHLEWQPLDAVVAHLQLAVSQQQLDLGTMLTRHDLDSEWVSQLQQQQQRWTTLALGPWQNAVAAEAHVRQPSLMQRGVSVQAPLQHLIHFPLDERGAWSWHQLLVTLQLPASTPQTLLQAQLKGMSYARL